MWKPAKQTENGRVSFVIRALFILHASAAFGQPIIGGLRENLDPVIAGRALLSELNCVACHAEGVSRKGVPDLGEAGSRIERDYLVEFLLNPHETKPGTTMPDLLGAVPDGQSKEVAGALADYVLSLGKVDPRIPELSSPDPQASERGDALFHEVGCVACHSPGESPIAGSVPLHRLGEKHRLSTLVDYLENPQSSRPEGRMPNLKLSHTEAVDIAAYLLGSEQAVSASPPTADRVAEGKKWFDALHCGQCHEAESALHPDAHPFSQKRPATDCKAADYDLSQNQQSWIAAALESWGDDLDANAEIQIEMIQLNCVACHERGGYGGPVDERDQYFTTSNLNLGEQARIPPSLSNVGAKLTPDTMRDVVSEGRSYRPYIHTRMPAFGSKAAKGVVDLILETDKLPEAEFDRVKNTKEAREAGRNLVGDKFLSCVACHTFNDVTTTTLNAVDLTTMADRLNENWFHLYLRNPQKFHATTIMPGFWPDGKSVRPSILGGDAGKQIDAIWQYLQRGRQARLPSGVRPEPIHYGPLEDEAVMLRRQYKGIGKRGIGVGYPAGINLVFDAAHCRIGTIWKGPFAEMSGVWRGQGSGNVKEEGKEILRFPHGPSFAVIEADDSAWPVVEEATKAPGYQFEGYTLDSKQRPTFRYSFFGIEIEDGFLDVAEGSKLVRTIKLKGQRPDRLFFRVAASKELSEGLGESTFRVDDRLQLTISAAGQLRKIGENRELVVPLAELDSLTITYEFIKP